MELLELHYNEQELVTKALQGNLESLTQLLHYNYDKVYGYLVKLILNPELAADLTQESFTKAIERLEQYQSNRASFSTWLTQIAINTSKDWYRKERRQKEFIENIEKQALSNLVSNETLGYSKESYYDKDDLIDVLIILKKMPLKIRLPIILKYYYGYQQIEIAGFMRIPVGTVKSRISNGLKKIRKELEK